jgi:hypothetical protein
MIPMNSAMFPQSSVLRGGSVRKSLDARSAPWAVAGIECRMRKRGTKRRTRQLAFPAPIGVIAVLNSMTLPPSSAFNDWRRAPPSGSNAVVGACSVMRHSSSAGTPMRDLMWVTKEIGKRRAGSPQSQDGQDSSEQFSW